MIKLSLEQRAVLVGTVLGDGYLQKTGKKNARLRLEQGARQKDYLLWKVKMLHPLFQGKAKYIERIHPLTKKTYAYWRHQSQSTPYLGKMQRYFYSEDGRKVIPKDIEKQLNSFVLAVWYMDDGYYYQRDRCSYLYLGRVCEMEAEIARSAISRKFGLEVKVLNKKEKGYAIYFSPKEVKKLAKILKGHILDQFKYKFPVDPVTT